MTFDDGILNIYNVTNDAEPGDMPKEKIKLKAQYYYGISRLGITRYYKALQADQTIEKVVKIPGWDNISSLDICELEEDQYLIRMAQQELDEDGLQITVLSLERVRKKYEKA